MLLTGMGAPSCRKRSRTLSFASCRDDKCSLLASEHSLQAFRKLRAAGPGHIEAEQLGFLIRLPVRPTTSFKTEAAGAKRDHEFASK